MWIQSTTRGLRFVLTDKKGYYGLIPTVAKEADTCAYLRGARAAFCLRKTENVQKYKILGDACFLNSDVWSMEEGTYNYKILDDTGLTAESNFEEHTINLI